MNKWEYKFHPVTLLVQHELNKLGDAGWELFAVTPAPPDIGRHRFNYWFKRPVAPVVK